MEPLPGNGYPAFFFIAADMCVIKALASNIHLLFFGYSGIYAARHNMPHLL
jgi:hypothetical protein